MVWVIVWVVLVVGTGVGAFFLARDVLRRAGRTMSALDEASQVVATLETKVAELDAVRPPTEPYAPDEKSARARREELRAVREERRRLRQERHATTIASWRELTR